MYYLGIAHASIIREAEQPLWADDQDSQHVLFETGLHYQSTWLICRIEQIFALNYVKRMGYCFKELQS